MLSLFRCPSLRFPSKPNPRVPREISKPQNLGVYSEPWWRGIQYSPVSQVMSGAKVTNSSSLERPHGDSESSEGQSLSNNGLNEEDDDATKESQPPAPNQSGNYGQEHQGLQHASSSVPPVHDDCLTQTPHLELVGHTVACAPNPYQDTYYGGMMAAYAHQQMVCPLD
ncbi:hypothetical protein RJT34_10704 [Clitoria ternatea]|uniref:Uncharacterized protein n=1 Tax=Clitoria ternatea TaxID=43366 RepID=A0AAN9JKH5_CLITE